MAFSRIAQSERKIIQSKGLKEEMTEHGWCEAPIPIIMLEQLGIDFRMSNEMLPRYSSGSTSYVPAWVWAARHQEQLTYDPNNANSVQEFWGRVYGRLARLKQDYDAQEIACTELTLNPDMPRSIREAARNYVARLQGRPK